MPLTLLSRNLLIAFSLLSVYAFSGGFDHPILSFILFGGITACLVGLISMPANEDMDTLTASCIHKLSAKCPPGDIPPPHTQNGFIFFESKVDFAAARALVVSKWFHYKRFSCVATLKPKSALWNTRWKPIELNEQVYDRMIKYHEVNNEDELYALIDKLCNEHLPKDLPQWIFHHINNNNGVSVWVLRVSHGIADGIRLVPIAAELLQNADGTPCGPPKGKILAKRKGRRRGPNIWLNPKTYYNIIRDIHKVWYMVNGPCDTIGPFKPDGRLHAAKQQLHLRNKVPIKVDDIRLLKNKYGVSFNDVVTCLTCSGLRHWMKSQDPTYFKKNKKVDMTSCLAFGFPPKEEFLGQKNWLKNGFVLVSWAFPVGIADFERRLQVISQNSKVLKTSFVTPVTMAASGLLARLGLDEAQLQNGTGAFTRHSCVFSNLPSFDKQLYYNGVKVVKLEASYYNWIPQFLFLSYNGGMYGTLTVDPERFPNAQLILDGIDEELARLLK
eukprot:28983_1